MFNPHVLEPHDEEELRRAISAVGVQAKGLPILTRKGLFQAVKLHGVGFREALIAKQEMLGAGGDAATPKGLVEFSRETADIILMGTMLHFRRFISKMRSQPFKCEALADEVADVLENYSRRTFTLHMPNGKLRIDRALVMGVLNVTPDSFSDGGLFLEPDAAVERGVQIEREGADLIDVGAESTRPGSEPVSLKEEKRRLEPVLEGLLKRVNVPISVDTYKPEIAAMSLSMGASIVNDVTGLRDEKMIGVVAKHDAPVIIMHMQGDPQTMQQNPQYDDVVADILGFLRTRVEAAVKGGVDEERIVVDPGIGFGKTLEHNLEILRRLGEFKSMGRPILVGVSRKSFIGRVLDLDEDQRQEGGLAAATMAVLKGANIVRTHDVLETVRALRVTDAILGSRWTG